MTKPVENTKFEKILISYKQLEPNPFPVMSGGVFIFRA